MALIERRAPRGIESRERTSPGTFRLRYRKSGWPGDLSLTFDDEHAARSEFRKLLREKPTVLVLEQYDARGGWVVRSNGAVSAEQRRRRLDDFRGSHP